MFWTLLAYAAGVYALMVLAVWALQDRMVYVPTRNVFTDPAKAHALPFEDLALKTEDGLTIRAWYTPADDPRAVLLFCHGNGGNLAHRADVIKGFHDQGFSSLIFDYRGYGHSEGRPSEQGTYLDAQAAWDFLVNQRGISRRSIVIIGRSLGGPIAARTAARNSPAGLSLEACATSAVDVGRQMFPYLPVSLLLRHRYDAVHWLNQVRCPVMISHGIGDSVIAFSHGQRLHELAAEPKRFVQLDGGHLEGYTDGSPKYPAALAKFVAECVTEGDNQMRGEDSDSTRL